MKSLTEIIGGILYPAESGPPLQFFNTQTTLPPIPKEDPEPKQPTSLVPSSDEKTEDPAPKAEGQKAA